MQDNTYKTMYLLRAREQHESELTKAIREGRNFTMLLKNKRGEQYGVRHGTAHMPNTGGVWKP